MNRTVPPRRGHPRWWHFLAVLGLCVLYGVLAAVGLSILDLLHRLARPHGAVLGFVPGVSGMHDVDDYPDAETESGLVIYRYDAPLCFANAEDFRWRALAAADDDAHGPVEWFVLNAEANVELDITAAGPLELIDAGHLYPTLPSAVDAFRNREPTDARTE